MKRFGTAWQWIMLPLTALYGLAIWCRNLAWQTGWLKPEKVPVTVISVGNLTAGGTGKTPVTAWLAGILIREGFTVGLVSRGYGRSTRGFVLVSDGRSVLVTADQGGDEPVELARSLPGLLVAVSEKRLIAANHLCAHFKPDVLIMDDGFQHRALHRDMDIVVQDYPSWIGTHWLLPSGPFREPVSGLNRAHWLVWTRTAPGEWPVFRRTEPVHQALFAQEPATLIEWSTGNQWPVSSLPFRRVAAIAGIGDPDQFFLSLQKSRLPVVVTRAFPDHEPYPQPVKSDVVQWMLKAGCEALIMTAKDAVKWSAVDLPAGITGLMVLSRVVPDPSLARLSGEVIQRVRPS
ncbi:MAG: tetraacyldisaccharide 4'-kinase [Bacteroidetes bacterium]|nr:tetraacyldisaccharide 4'-kinase [Bacteroidota bacterium]